MMVIKEVKKSHSGKYQGIVTFPSEPILKDCIAKSFDSLHIPSNENNHWGLRPSLVDGYTEAHCEFETTEQAIRWNDVTSSLLTSIKNKNI